MNFTDLFATALATWQAVEIWHHGSLFADSRAGVEAWPAGWLRSLLLCPFCLSVWVALALAALVSIAQLPSANHAALVQFAGVLLYAGVRLPIYALAVSRLANLGNDLAHARCRTPREDDVVAETGDAAARRAGHDSRLIARTLSPRDEGALESAFEGDQA